MARRVIALMGEPLVHEEHAAGGTITPGDLVNLNSSNAVIRHATAGGNSTKMFALERDELGKPITTPSPVGPAGSADYASGDVVKVGHFHSGQRVYAWIASGQNITQGAFLEAAADGTLRVLASGVALAQALDSSGAVTVKTRLRVSIV